jgi:RHS repeat-associated protein
VLSQQYGLPGNPGAGTHLYAYDNAARLTGWTKPGTPTPVVYTYDKAGNRTSAAGITYTYDDHNRVTNSSDGSVFTYTKRGTLATETKAGVTTNSWTDALGRVVQTGANMYTYDDWDRIIQRTGTSIDASRGPAPQAGTTTVPGATTTVAPTTVAPTTVAPTTVAPTTIAPTTVAGPAPTTIPRQPAPQANPATFSYAGLEKDPVSDRGQSFFRTPSGRPVAVTTNTSPASIDGFRWIGTNRHGDITQLLDPNLVNPLVGSQTFDPFGQALSAPVVRLGFQGSWTEPDTKLPWMQARWYQPKTATFTNRDTLVGGVGGATVGHNRYTYAANNPMTFWDPTGRVWDRMDGGGFDPKTMGDDVWAAVGWNIQTPGSNGNIFKPGAKRNVVTGSDNLFESTAVGNTVVGDRNYVDNGHGNLIIGSLNTVVGSLNYVYGNTNFVGGSGNIVGGNNNSVNGSGNFVSGSNNALLGSRNHLTGNWNLLYGNDLRRKSNNVIYGDFRVRSEMSALGQTIFGIGDFLTRNGFSSYSEGALKLAMNELVGVQDCGPCLADQYLKSNTGFNPSLAIYTLAFDKQENADYRNQVQLLRIQAISGIVNATVAFAYLRATNGVPCASFRRDTLVLMADRTKKPIGKIEIGDKVVATDPFTGKTSVREVKKLFMHIDEDLLDLVVLTGDRVAKIHTTDHHRFWNDTRGEWVEAKDLRTGERLLSSDGDLVTIGELKRVPGAAPMLDLAIEYDHTFYVVLNTNAVLVHNQDCVEASQWIANQKPGRKVVNVQTDVTVATFESELVSSGWTARTRSDGTREYLKGGNMYSVRDRSDTGGPTADFFPAGSAGKASIKVRLQP